LVFCGFTPLVTVNACPKIAEKTLFIVNWSAYESFASVKDSARHNKARSARPSNSINSRLSPRGSARLLGACSRIRLPALVNDACAASATPPMPQNRPIGFWNDHNGPQADGPLHAPAKRIAAVQKSRTGSQQRIPNRYVGPGVSANAALTSFETVVGFPALNVEKYRIVMWPRPLALSCTRTRSLDLTFLSSNTASHAVRPTTGSASACTKSQRVGFRDVCPADYLVFGVAAGLPDTRR
jgi:hypothetical protein